MKIRAKMILGSVAYEFSTDGKLDKEALGKLIVLANPRKLCNECADEGYDNKYFTSNKDKEGNIYINVKCKCGARSKLGFYKSGGFFWHDYEVYRPKEEVKTENPPMPDTTVKSEKEPKNEEDIPF